MRHTYPIRHTYDLVGTAQSLNQTLWVSHFQARIQLHGTIVDVSVYVLHFMSQVSEACFWQVQRMQRAYMAP